MTVPTTMRALRQLSSNGTQDMLLVTDAPVPIPGPGEVLVRVVAAGVNHADVSRARGTFLGGPRPPYTAGFEAAGEVVAVGDGVREPAVGTCVVGIGEGAFAEHVVLSAAGAMPVPAGWTPAQALGLAVNHLTALAALTVVGRIAAGETVLVHAAAGATGQAAVVLAKHVGATVIAAAAPAKHDVVRALGADHVLDSRSDDLTAQVLARTGGAGADLVLESAGGAAFAASLAATRPVAGRVVVLGLPGGTATVSNWDLVYRYPVQVVGFNVGALGRHAPHLVGAVVAELATLVADGVVTPVDPTTYALADGVAALADLQARTTVGKLALLP